MGAEQPGAGRCCVCRIAASGAGFIIKQRGSEIILPLHQVAKRPGGHAASASICKEPERRAPWTTSSSAGGQGWSSVLGQESTEGAPVRLGSAMALLAGRIQVLSSSCKNSAQDGTEFTPPALAAIPVRTSLRPQQRWGQQGGSTNTAGSSCPTPWSLFGLHTTVYNQHSCGEDVPGVRKFPELELVKLMY